MGKIFYLSSSDRLKAEEKNVRPFWFTIADESDVYLADVLRNPWNGDDAEIVAEKFYFSNDCVITIHPAQSHQECEPKKRHFKGEYFLEISDYDASTKYSSRKLYRWEEIIKLASMFKGLSFLAAQRIWRFQKL
jgi:hypothetical protein